VLATNTVPVVTAVLSWPVTPDNYSLEFWYDLSPLSSFDGLSGPLWQPVAATPVIVNGWNRVTNTTFNSTGFYRLSRNPE